LAGTTVRLAQFVTTEKAVGDCGKPRAVQVWLTDTTTAPPKDRTRLSGPIGLPDSCPSPRLTWDAADLIQRGGRRPHHGDVRDATAGRATGRSVALPALQPRANTGGHQFSVTPTDPDPFDQLTVEFAWWPADHGGYRRQVFLQQSAFTDNTAYVLRVRVDDGHESATASCRFTTDFAAPPAPTVSSSDYPTDVITGSSGIPGPTYVAANHRGGTATVSIAPPRIGANRLSVAAVDAAGNESSRTDYEFAVNDNRPTVACTPEDAAFDTPRTCTITRFDATEVGLVYQVNNGPSMELAPGPDGTATFTTTLDEPGQRVRVDARARLANGNLTDLSSCWLSADVD
jgi:hypothetical protein